MNFIKSQTAITRFIGQCRKPIVEAISRRKMCNKPQDTNAHTSPPAHGATAPSAGFRVPGYRPSDFDRKILVWSGRFKTADHIPELVSFEMVDAARNKVRVKVCYVMMGVTIGACLVMVILGKRAVGRHESLTGQNMDKKAKWKEAFQKEKENADIAMPEKAVMPPN